MLSKFSSLIIVGVLLLMLLNPAYGFSGQKKDTDKFSPEQAWAVGYRSLNQVPIYNDVPKTFKNSGTWTHKKSGPNYLFNKIWGEGILVGTQAMKNDQAALQAAKMFWQDHSDMLPDGLDISDFKVWTNKVSVDVRYVSHQQMLDDVPVLGASIYVAIKAGRIVMAESRSFPVTHKSAIHKIDSDSAVKLAIDGMNRQKGFDYKNTESPKLLWMPLISKGQIDFQLVQKVSLRSSDNIRYSVYIDATNGELVSIKDERLMAMTASIKLSRHQRHIGTPLVSDPAKFMIVDTGSTNVRTNEEGQFSLTTPTSTDVDLTLNGTYIEVINAAGGDLTASVQDMSHGQQYLWQDQSEFGQAQLDAYAFVSHVRLFAKSMVSDVSWINSTKIDVTVNYSNDEYPACNAWFDGNLTFLKAGTIYDTSCNNTAMLGDVVYHEYGHGFHYYSLLGGVGDFAEDVSEGFADFMSTLITEDYRLGMAFTTDGSYLRNLEENKVWPDDNQEDPHKTGLIVGGALWDLRKELINKHDETEGMEIVKNIYSQMVKTTTDVPSTYEAALLADDDNGNLSDGTPHICSINAAFALHGLSQGNAGGGLSITHEQIGNVALSELSLKISADVFLTSAECSDADIGEVKLVYSINSESNKTVDMTDGSGDEYYFDLANLSEGDAIRYHFEVTNSNKATYLLPDNQGDPNYYAYIGDLSEIVCYDFESSDSLWTHELLSGTNQEGADDWQRGTPSGRGGDPKGAFGGSYIWGNDLALEDHYNGLYQASIKNKLSSPELDFSDSKSVRLQFMRWLTVEDASYDSARIYVNNEIVWSNSGGNDKNSIDKEWIFFDLDISEQAAGKSAVTISWEIESDSGMELGGWNIDNVCLYESDALIIDGDTDNDIATDGDITDGDFAEYEDIILPDGDDLPDGDSTTDGDNASDGDVVEGGGIVLPDGDFEDDVQGGSGGISSDGCQSVTPSGFALFVLLFLLALKRRRTV